MSTIMYTYDLRTGAFAGSRPAQIVGGKELTECANATSVAPPADIPAGHAARWTGSAWEVVEDHRRHMDAKGTKRGGTPYWLPAEGDDWQSPARYMETLGALPAGAVTVRPEKPAELALAEARAARTAQIEAGYQAALSATLTMPQQSPSAQDVAVGAALFAVDDVEGLEYVVSRHAATRAALLDMVAAAATPAEVEAIAVAYAV